MNYNDVVNRFKEIVQDHRMLVDFGYGQISDIKTRSEGMGELEGADYPYLFLNPAVHQRTESQITYNFNMIIMDMAREEVADPYQNFLNIQSDCIQYCDDVLARLRYHYKDKPEILFQLGYTPFYERFQDDLAGVTANISIVVPNSINECIAPFIPECIATLDLFSTNENDVDYVRSPGVGGLRYEEDLTSNPIVGTWDDQYFLGAVAGTYQFEINNTFVFDKPAVGQELPGVPHLKYFANPPGVNVEIAPTCDSGNWPEVWTPNPITYKAIYNLTLEQAQDFITINSLDNGGDYVDFTQKAGGTLDIGILFAPINRVYVNVEECPAFDTAFRAGARDEVNYPEYTKQYNEFFARYDEPGEFVSCNNRITPLAINDRNSTTEPYYDGTSRQWIIPAGVEGQFKLDFDLEMTNVQGIDLSEDRLRIQLIINGQTQTYYDLPELPIDGTVVPFKESFTVDASSDDDEFRILFRYNDEGTPAPDGPLVGYTGTAIIKRAI